MLAADSGEAPIPAPGDGAEPLDRLAIDGRETPSAVDASPMPLWPEACIAAGPIATWTEGTGASVEPTAAPARETVSSAGVDPADGGLCGGVGIDAWFWAPDGSNAAAAPTENPSPAEPEPGADLEEAQFFPIHFAFFHPPEWDGAAGMENVAVDDTGPSDVEISTTALAFTAEHTPSAGPVSPEGRGTAAATTTVVGPSHDADAAMLAAFAGFFSQAGGDGTVFPPQAGPRRSARR